MYIVKYASRAKCICQRGLNTIVYRSYKDFKGEIYVTDLEIVSYQVCEIFDTPDDSYWFYQKMLKGVIISHSLLKKKIA